MAFNNIIIKPSNDVYMSCSSIVFQNVRSTSEHKTMRNRQCYKCGNTIYKHSQYINHQFRYDKRILTISFHCECFNSKENEK